MAVSDQAVFEARRANTSAERRLVLAFADRGHTRGRPGFSFRDVHVILFLTKGLSARSNAHRHVNELVSAGLLERQGQRNCIFTITELGEAACRDWALTGTPASRDPGEPPTPGAGLPGAVQVAESAAQLLDDLVKRLKGIAEAAPARALEDRSR